MTKCISGHSAIDIATVAIHTHGDATATHSVKSVITLYMMHSQRLVNLNITTAHTVAIIKQIYMYTYDVNGGAV